MSAEVQLVDGHDVFVGRHRREEDDEFRLLFICTGNVCRSPFAAIVTRHLLNERLGYGSSSSFDIGSAGVQAVVGTGVHPMTREQLRSRGLDSPAVDRFVARQMDGTMLASAHLVLGATRRHRALAAQAAPSALSTTFALREFARLAASIVPTALPADPVPRAHALVEAVRRHRGLVPPVSPAEDDVLDPMGGPVREHAAAAQSIDDAVRIIVDILAPPLRGAGTAGNGGVVEIRHGEISRHPGAAWPPGPPPVVAP
ncbi:low molecular weight phosphatase family protein [Geodermatophilus sp. SYSU D00705]